MASIDHHPLRHHRRHVMSMPLGNSNNILHSPRHVSEEEEERRRSVTEIPSQHPTVFSI